MDFPIAEKRPQKLQTFDDIRVDNYYWMKDRENPEVVNYLNQENEYTDHVLAPVKKL